ncbi:hypothetical protein [Bacillus mycoides]|uniref:hypothetical protein n=1 Tax=Bacillus mycoides TaxID=1405 RepID=UPI0013A5BD48|nr:hypothetical protein [Bacillus mycoides]
MSSVSIQEKINELNRIERSSEHYLNKYNEILTNSPKEFFFLKRVKGVSQR